jgi:thiamine kinase-like enzyme
VTIDEAIARIPGWEEASSVRVAALPGGITNDNYRVEIDGEAFVLRICARGAGLLGIDRNREYRCTVAASRTGVAPEVVHFLPEQGIMVTRFVAGRSLSPGEIAGPEVTARVVQAMHRYHAGPAFEGSFSAHATVARYLRTARRRRAPLPDDVDGLRSQVFTVAAALRAGETIVRPCHNDLWGPNLIDDGCRVRIVDWEYAGMGDVYFDLANFAMHHTASESGDEALLRHYFGEATDRGFARLQLVKLVAELREALWYLVALSVRGYVSDFVERARTHFDRCREGLGNPQLAAWLELAAGHS